ncbi:hypothetical protein CQW23_28559 [Capsicum baccatum]|uniref:Uncharacterized protein n=1 Tax=Capsicum baccatum TaxID=33114 RepID=A0A2G2VGX7_CAPBA|nr:hypothetical protein CQW23_28559 [Capsicum baccatum]
MKIGKSSVSSVDVAATPLLLLLCNGDVATPFETDRADVFSPKPLDFNEDEYINKDQPPRADKEKLRKCNIEKQVKKKVDRVNLDEITSGLVGIDIGFQEIRKNEGARYKGKLGGDDPYFDSSDPSSDISEEEKDPIDGDEVVNPPPRT